MANRWLDLAAHPPGACPGVPAAWLPAAALRLIRKVLFI
jgi:hypothetical protein